MGLEFIFTITYYMLRNLGGVSLFKVVHIVEVS